MRYAYYTKNQRHSELAKSSKRMSDRPLQGPNSKRPAPSRGPGATAPKGEEDSKDSSANVASSATAFIRDALLATTLPLDTAMNTPLDTASAMNTPLDTLSVPLHTPSAVGPAPDTGPSGCSPLFPCSQNGMPPALGFASLLATIRLHSALISRSPGSALFISEVSLNIASESLRIGLGGASLTDAMCNLEFKADRARCSEDGISIVDNFVAVSAHTLAGVLRVPITELCTPCGSCSTRSVNVRLEFQDCSDVEISQWITGTIEVGVRVGLTSKTPGTFSVDQRVLPALLDANCGVADVASLSSHGATFTARLEEAMSLLLSKPTSHSIPSPQLEPPSEDDRTSAITDSLASSPSATGLIKEEPVSENSDGSISPFSSGLSYPTASIRVDPGSEADDTGLPSLESRRPNRSATKSKRTKKASRSGRRPPKVQSTLASVTTLNQSDRVLAPLSSIHTNNYNSAPPDPLLPPPPVVVTASLRSEECSAFDPEPSTCSTFLPDTCTYASVSFDGM